MRFFSTDMQEQSFQPKSFSILNSSKDFVLEDLAGFVWWQDQLIEASMGHWEPVIKKEILLTDISFALKTFVYCTLSSIDKK